jgi:catechol 2,3-dioxygenase-like lactoylglutathione lyase family enzyme
VFFVSDVQAALRFYLDKLGFEKRWHEADGKGTVCQVNRGECEIILCQDAARRGKGRLFVELTPDGLDELRREIAERSVPNEKASWGYDVIRIADPDGNGKPTAQQEIASASSAHRLPARSGCDASPGSHLVGQGRGLRTFGFRWTRGSALTCGAPGAGLAGVPQFSYGFTFSTASPTGLVAPVFPIR